MRFIVTSRVWHSWACHVACLIPGADVSRIGIAAGPMIATGYGVHHTRGPTQTPAQSADHDIGTTRNHAMSDVPVTESLAAASQTETQSPPETVGVDEGPREIRKGWWQRRFKG